MKPIKCQSTLLNNKRAKYIREMKAIDIENKALIAHIGRVSATLGKLNAQLNISRQKRESVKRKISRYKQIIKNKNRDDNGQTIV